MYIKKLKVVIEGQQFLISAWLETDGRTVTGNQKFQWSQLYIRIDVCKLCVFFVAFGEISLKVTHVFNLWLNLFYTSFFAVAMVIYTHFQFDTVTWLLYSLARFSHIFSLDCLDIENKCCVSVLNAEGILDPVNNWVHRLIINFSSECL